MCACVRVRACVKRKREDECWEFSLNPRFIKLNREVADNETTIYLTWRECTHILNDLFKIN